MYARTVRTLSDREERRLRRQLARFPTTDFSYAECRDEGGEMVDARFTLRGEKLAPTRRIPPESQRGLDLSRGLELLPGRLDRLERLLRSRGSEAERTQGSYDEQ